MAHRPHSGSVGRVHPLSLRAHSSRFPAASVKRQSAVPWPQWTSPRPSTWTDVLSQRRPLISGVTRQSPPMWIPVGRLLVHSETFSVLHSVEPFPPLHCQCPRHI